MDKMQANLSFYHSEALCTPVFMVDCRLLRRDVERICKQIGEHANLLYSVKSLLTESVIQSLSSQVGGYSVSSLNEAMFCHEFMPKDKTLHFISPFISDTVFSRAKEFCHSITLNSMSQLGRLEAEGDSVDLGIRVNPGISFVGDSRYDPCRLDSKLGVPLSTLRELASSGGLLNVKGLHFHTNCDSNSIQPLIQTLEQIEYCLGYTLADFEWINCGGGYIYSIEDEVDMLNSTFDRLRSKYDLKIYAEPGAAFVRNAGVLISSVVDILEHNESAIAILDTTVNHWPEVFEYQFEPDVLGHIEDGKFTYQLAGCSCLAGDIFGTYSFNEPLEIGSRIVFENAGAYSIVKAHMFNGINLPTIYTLTESGELVLTKQFTYADFASRCGVETRATV